jgi:hypothetical protein
MTGLFPNDGLKTTQLGKILVFYRVKTRGRGRIVKRTGSHSRRDKMRCCRYKAQPLLNSTLQLPSPSHDFFYPDPDPVIH